MAQDKFDIFVKLIGGGDPVRLTHGRVDEYSLAWSPDGRYIASCARSRPPPATYLWWLPSERGAQIDGDVSGRSKSWLLRSQSLLERRIADGLCCPTRKRPTPPPRCFGCPWKPARKRRLTAPPPGSSGDWQPAVSPDGHALAFRRSITENVSDLYLLELSKKLDSSERAEAAHHR